MGEFKGIRTLGELNLLSLDHISLFRVNGEPPATSEPPVQTTNPG